MNSDAVVEKPVETGEVKTADDWKQEGNTYYGLSDYTNAVKAYTKAIEINPLQPSYYNNRAACNLTLKHYQEALMDSDAALTLNSQSAKAHRRRGLACMNLALFDQAILSLGEYLKMEMDHNIQKEYEETMAARDSFVEARECLEQKKGVGALKAIGVVEKKTEHHSILRLKCEIEARVGDTDGARGTLKRIVQSVTKAELMYLKSLIELNTTGTNTCKKYLEECIEAGDVNGRAQQLMDRIQVGRDKYHKGREEMAQGKYQNAISSLLEGLEKEWSNRILNSDICLKLGECYLQLSNHSKAEEYLNQSIQLNPINLQSYLCRIKLFTLKNSLPQSLADYKRLQQIDPNTDYKPLIKSLQAPPPLSDYYTILGVSKDSSQFQIKKAYKKRAIKYHPSKAVMLEDELNFYELTRIYETLIDPVKRALYDSGKCQEFKGLVNAERYLLENQIRDNEFFEAFMKGNPYIQTPLNK